MPPSPTRFLPLRGQIELNPRTINAPESPHDVLGLQGTPFGETIGLPEPLAGSGHHKVDPGAACICRLRPPGYCRRLPAPTTTYGKCIEMRVGSGVGAAMLLADQRLNAPLFSAAAANSPPLSPGRRLGLLMPP